MTPLSKIALWVVALFYAYGALVHVANMASLTGFDWSSAPPKWQLLDILYLGLDSVVAIGLGQCWRVSITAFYIAAASQIILYTVGRSWVLDVPEDFRPDQQALAYLDSLVAFHIVTLIIVTLALWRLGRQRLCTE